MNPLAHDPMSRSLESASQHVKRPVQLLQFTALLLFVVSLFSVPFPFTRQIWLQSTVGVLGFVNCGLLMIFANRIQKLVYPAAFAGLGLVFHEQLLAWRGFLTLLYHNAVSIHDVLFLFGTLILTVGLGIIFWHCAKVTEKHSKKYSREVYLVNHKMLNRRAALFQSNAFVESVLGYGVLTAALWASHFLNLNLHFSSCKIIAELTCVLGFYGIGRELDLYFKDIQKRNVLTVKILSHLLVMAGVLWFIYRIMPIEPFLK